MRTWAFIALAWLGATGCGNLTAGGFGDVQVYANGDEEEPAPSPARAAAAAPERTHGITVGELDVSLLAFLRHEDGSGLQLGADELFAQNIAIDGSDERPLVIQVTPEGQYTEVHLIFSQMSVNVISGLPVLGDVTVDLDSTLTVSRSIDLDLSDDESIDLVVDLNAQTWLLAADPITRLVDPVVFSDAVEVRVR